PVERRPTVDLGRHPAGALAGAAAGAAATATGAAGGSRDGTVGATADRHRGQQFHGVPVALRAVRRVGGGRHRAVDLEGGAALTTTELVPRHGSSLRPVPP